MESTIEEAGGWSQIVEAGILTVVVSALTFLAAISRNVLRRRRFPPGPRGLPIFGSLFSLGTLHHQSLHKLAQQYGPLMFMYFGSVPALVVSNSEMAEVIFRTKDQIMASRPNLIVIEKFYGPASAFSPYGSYWRYIRKIQTLELLTARRINQFQAMRQREVLTMVHSVLETAQQGNAIIVSSFLFSLGVNNITQMMLNRSYWFAKGCSTLTSNDVSASFYGIVRELNEAMGEVNLSDYIPVLKPFDFQGFNKRIKAMRAKMDAFLESVLEEHSMRSLTGKHEKSNEDFVDVLLAVQKKLEAEEKLTIDGVKAIIREMITAGTETSAVTLEWALAELMRRPGMLRRAQEELDSVVGAHRLVEEADLEELKFIEAIVKETFRLHPPAPLLVPRESTQNCEIAGYHIPSGTRVLVNVWSLQRDPLVFERPLEFDPDRFLRSAMDVRGKDFGLLPFGSGRRICPGMNLALIMVRLSLAQMLHTINWSLPEGQKPEELDMSESHGIVCPKLIPLNAVVEQRLANNVIYPTNPM